MRKVQRSELLDYQSYDDVREAARKVAMEQKRPRRIHLPPCLTFLFENADTTRYQIQEIMRAERIVREADIQNEIATYNGLLGDDGELGCCLLVEIDDRAERERLLRQWRALPAHLYLRTAEGAQIRAQFDPGQVGEEKISSVQYLKFRVGQGRPVAIGCDLPEIRAEQPLDDEQQAALLADLRS